MNAKDAVQKAWLNGTVLPAYNIPYLPMVKPIVQAVIDNNSVAMLQVARVEWNKFASQSIEAVAEEYFKYASEKHTLLHLDHIPVIDEDLLDVDYMPLIERAIKAGYQSVMIDASRLELQDNIRITRKVADIAHLAGIPCEAELGSVMGHESKQTMTYEEIFKTKKGFTDVRQAKEFAEKSHCDWLSIAAGSIHGAVAENTRHQKKPEARLDISRIHELKEAVHLPLVLHGGSGIQKACIDDAVKNGIAKINVGTEIRQSYEEVIKKENNIEKAREAVYWKTCWIIQEFLSIKDSYNVLGD